MKLIEKFTSVLILSSFLFSCQTQSEGLLDQEKPNVVIFLTDDQGWGDLSISGNSNLSTPNIDGLAKAGVQFDRFFVNAVCSPTRAELLTGRYHTRMGITGTSAGKELLDPSETTIADLFAKDGYATGAFGKWHNGSQPPYHPNARGFQEYYGFTSGHWGNYFSPPLDHNGQIVQGDGFVVDDFTSKAIDFIEENKDKPFFAYLPYNTPHSPMQVPDKWWDKFANADLKMRHREPESEDLRHTRAALAMVENVDWNVGRILAKLEELELSENTIVIFFSDNGPNGNRWNDGMKGRKGSVDEGGLRSPLFIRWPKMIEAGLEIDRIASTLDLLPTLADLAGLDLSSLDKELDGMSLRDLLFNKENDWPDRHLLSTWRGKSTVRTQQFRLDSEGQLFDMTQDPGQHYDVASKYDSVHQQLVLEKSQFENEVVSLLDNKEIRYPIGHPDYNFTHLPSRDGIASDGIERSNRYPNDSYFLNWNSTEDYITWDVEVLTAGTYKVDLYYTIAEADLGAEMELSMGESKITFSINTVNDPPVTGAEDDRDPRQESYVKDFKAMPIGVIDLKTGEGQLKLSAMNIPGNLAPEIRLLSFTRE